ncbi:MAG: PolC-type DNA polymerase III [Clostridiales bacterium]|nr:PolC-type DNA polymerase III [Clostridiales bacterium]
MSKLFTEVFPTLEVSDPLEGLLEYVTVDRVAMNQRRDFMHVYIASDRLIYKKYVLELEKAIKEQLFSEAYLMIKVIEKFHLSRQYTPKRLMPLYEESIALELKEYNALLYSLFRQADKEFTDENTLLLQIPDSVVADGKEQELLEILEKIFCERCGLDFHVSAERTKPLKSRHSEQTAYELEQEIEMISRNYARVKQGGGMEPDASGHENVSDSDAGYSKRSTGADAALQPIYGGAEETFQGGVTGADDHFSGSRGGAKGSFQGSEDTSGGTNGSGVKSVSKSGDKGSRNDGAVKDGILNGKSAVSANGEGSRKGSSLSNGGGFDAGGQANAGRGFQKRRTSSDWYGGSRKSDNPDVLYGRDFEGEPLAIEKITGEIGGVILRGQVLSAEQRELRIAKILFIFTITDFTDTISVKMFLQKEEAQEVADAVKVGAFISLKGVTTIDRFDSQLTIGNVQGIKKIADFREKRLDMAVKKRVELHCHTKMSDMDGVSDVKDIIARAISWGQKAIAITDHGDVQAFPDANHAIPKDSDFKVIYGVEGYLVDDLKEIAVNEKGQELGADFVVFDLETTGFSPQDNRIIEIGAVKVQGGKITDKFSTFVNPQVPIPFRIEELTSINDSMVMDAPTIEKILPEFMEFCSGCVMVAHNASFDMSFIEENCARLGIPCDKTSVDTVAMARVLLPALNRFKLDTVAKAVGVSLAHHHRAVDDAGCTAEIFEKFLVMLNKQGITTLAQLNALGHSSKDQIKKLPTYHVIILAANEVGRTNLYRLVSWSHIDYYNRHPRIPKSVLQKYREGLLIGSACEAGELYRALVRGASAPEIARLVEFYDYLEIQPLGNNMFMTRDDAEDKKTVEDLQNYNRRIVELGEQYHKPVVATCDVHFLDPQDEIYRRIIMGSRGFKDADEQAPLYLRTTEEMLKEFTYLGEEKAYEVVVTNTNRIADMCERISPVRPDKCPPVIENSDQILRNLCYEKAHEIYGEELPPIVSERLERELHSIISNGFAVMYIIAQKLVWKSNADGYLVGSRGSVGSSFVATMSGITEVNPLSPHYICPNCHYSDFDSEDVRKFAGMAGCDMPDKICPKCGTKLNKEGFDIPFETFLGFKGNKEPDIDLNFSGEYQSKAHKYTEVIFGAGQTYRAGTIGTLADKTAFGYVKNYYEDRNIHKRNCEIDRIVQGCVGVRRTTGQHPGGIIVLPIGEEIYSFTPVQHPANDMTTDIVTTHFDYHSIDHNLLKLDILGHDDPTMIRMLQDLTGLDPKEIPLDDPQVMSLFTSTEALGITPEDIGGVPLGSLGIPEFGTEFAMQMLIDTKPTHFSDLVRIAGLAHGTDVWLGNAQTLIQEGKATISTAICTRDDIMIYLIGKGLDSELSFTIMESVRKGKGLKPEWETEMIAHDVPDWYIWSCKKIKYMFPKAHAAAYVMMAWRIAYCKINYPQAYYAAYFSIRASGFDYELMCLGKEKLLYHMADYEKRMDSLSKKEQDTYKDMKSVLEMYARGLNFVPIDIYKAQATRFQIVGNDLMPSLNSISGLGEKAAASIVDACKDGPFLSKDDFMTRAKVGKTMTDLLADLKILDGLPETNQLSLFDVI